MLNYVNYRMRVTLLDGRAIVGRFMAFDRHMNLVLSDCEEWRLTPPKKVPFPPLRADQTSHADCWSIRTPSRTRNGRQPPRSHLTTRHRRCARATARSGLISTPPTYTRWHHLCGMRRLWTLITRSPYCPPACLLRRALIHPDHSAPWPTGA
jgi:small nuclear ribonucleoprotein (snRNP)-like protein